MFWNRESISDEHGIDLTGRVVDCIVLILFRGSTTGPEHPICGLSDSRCYSARPILKISVFPEKEDDFF